LNKDKQTIASQTSAAKKNSIAKSLDTKKAENKTKTKKTVKAATLEKIIPDSKKPSASLPRVSKKTPLKEPSEKKITRKVISQVRFQLRYRTKYGQEILICGNHPLLGNGDPLKAVSMYYNNDDRWSLDLDFSKSEPISKAITYQYIIRNNDESLSFDAGNDKQIDPNDFNSGSIITIDSWNFAGYIENVFYTEPFTNVLLKGNHTEIKTPTPKRVTHEFKVKTPLLIKGQTLCIVGSCKGLSKWDTNNPILMYRKQGENYFSVGLDLTQELFPIAYKYGIYDTIAKKFLQFEQGNNRVLYETNLPEEQTIIHDGFLVIPEINWKASGVAIPVFSLKSENSFGVGEFTDIKLLVDWAVTVGMKLIQILPINDTTATYTWTDSYPYASISAFALHPMYLNLDLLANNDTAKDLNLLKSENLHLNNLDVVDYETVNQVKLSFIKKAFQQDKLQFLKDKSFQQYFIQNSHWLEPYAVFCYLRDQYKTADFSQWPKYQQYNKLEVNELIKEGSTAFEGIALHYFTQYHLHLQLKAATDYAHSMGIIVKGDIPIGIYRNGADAWQQPELYHMDMQAGAPPDGFAIKGQNWGFPTYNWQKMKEDGFAWWKQRFEQMNYYFDAFRIDHILGFFRIWSIPMDAVEGIMGYFVPAIPMHVNEFNSKNIWFDYHRYTKPFITESTLWEVFGYDNEFAKKQFLEEDGYSGYKLKPEFATQRLVEQYFNNLENNEYHQKQKQQLFDLISNVILFEVDGSQGQQFHFRFGMESTSSFRNLDWNTQNQLKELFIQYFYKRQDDFWMQEALQKLPALKRVTNMLVCGEDLGMVPTCVPEVMRQLGLLSLEIQRMPKDPAKEFFHPNDAPYLSVVTPSTHDMSTIRGWWEEDRESIQKFYNHELGQQGEAPFYCEAWINNAIVLQHLYSPAMWSIFQLQDIMGIDPAVRRENPNDERINIPANPKHYWRYRMHHSLETLLGFEMFNQTLGKAIKASGRS
jgi:4-alpha-glucanotransferase